MLKEALDQSGVAGLLGWTDSDNDNGENIFQRAFATAIYPFQILISPTAIKAYLSIILFLITSFVLLSLSTTAFGLFYYNFIPQTDFERPIYLQYAADSFPRADIPLKTNALISQQPYDVSIVLHMPRDPVNLNAGNFMLDLTLHAKTVGSEASVFKTTNRESPSSTLALHHSRRPAIMPYASPLSDLISKLVRMPLHLLSFHDSDSVSLTIPMFEEVVFARGKENIPTYAALEVQSQRPPLPLQPLGSKDTCSLPQLHVYNAKLIFQVRFHGLRYLIYNYRLVAFVAFSGLFYVVSISTLALVWAALATLLQSPQDEKSLVKIEDKQIKQEHGTSDPLRTTSDYRSDKTPKLRGTDDSENETVNLRDTWSGPPPLVDFTPQTSEQASATSQDPAVVETAGGRPEEHADDEDELSEDEWQQLQRLRKRMEHDARQRQLQMQQADSGLGTSLESENTSGAGLVRRTSSKKGSGRET